MAHFNYKRAWREAADPAFRALPEHVLGAVEQLAELVKDKQQERETLAVRLDDPEREIMKSIPTPQLARLSCIVHDWGHWHSGPKGETWQGRMLQNGGHWKIANLCDQVLAVRCGIPQKWVREGSGVTFRIHEGVIRAQVSGGSERRNTDWSTGADITFADEGFVLRTSNSRPNVSAVPDRDYLMAREWLDALKQSERALLDPESDPAVKLLDAGETFREEKVLCKRCGMRLSTGGTLGEFYAEELCPAGHCLPGSGAHPKGRGCCTCDLAEFSEPELRALIRGAEYSKLWAEIDALDREGLERRMLKFGVK